MVIYYFIIGLLLLIPLLSTCLNDHSCFICVKVINVFYLGAKLIVLIFMIIIVQNAHYNNWDAVVCNNIRPLTTFWLVWNYIIMCLSFIYLIIYIASSTCDYYDEYDYEPDY